MNKGYIIGLLFQLEGNVDQILVLCLLIGASSGFLT